MVRKIYEIRMQLIFLLFLSIVFSPAHANIAAIMSISGNSKIHKKTGQIYPAIKNDHIYEGDSVWTEDSTTMHVRMIDGTMICIGPNSELRFVKYKSKAQGGLVNESIIYLINGSIRVVNGAVEPGLTQAKFIVNQAEVSSINSEYEALIVGKINSDIDDILYGSYFFVHKGRARITHQNISNSIDSGGQYYVGDSKNNYAEIFSRLKNRIGSPYNSNCNVVSINPIKKTDTIKSNDKQVKMTVRYGPLNRDSKEYRIKLDRDSRSRVSLDNIMGGVKLRFDNEIFDSANTEAYISILGDGRQSNIILRVESLNANGSRLKSGLYELHAELQPGVWTEVTDQGPWRALNKAIAGSSVVFNMERVYIRADID